MSYGYIDSGDVDLGANIDSAYLEGLRTRAGLDFVTILGDLQAALGGLNTNIEPTLAAMVAPPTTEAYTNGTGSQPKTVQVGQEYGLPRPQKSVLKQYPLALGFWQMGAGWTERGLMGMSRPRWAQELTDFTDGWRRHYRRRAYRRFFVSAEYPVAEGTTSLSPGLAGSGSGLNAFTNKYPTGAATAGGYTLYYRVASGSLATGLLTAVQELRLWNKGATLELIASQAMLTLIAAINPGNAVTGFVNATSNLVTVGNGTAAAQVDPMQFAGVLFGDVKVRQADSDVPANYIGIYASYGQLSPRNVLVSRYDALYGRGLKVQSRSAFPLHEAVAEQYYEMNINNRTGGAAIYVAGSGSYVDPTDLD